MHVVSIILPTYNESSNIIPLIRAITKTLNQKKQRFEILVVDDNSPDLTAKIVTQFASENRSKNIRAICRTKNPGLGNSIKQGILEAKGDIIIGMDGDFNHDPATLPLLITALESADLVVASRFVPGGGMANVPRMISSQLINKIFFLLGMPISDNTSGYYAISRKKLVTLDLDQIYYGYGDYHLRLVAIAKKKGYCLKEVPTFYYDRLGGESKSQFSKMFFSYFKEVWRLRSITV